MLQLLAHLNPGVWCYRKVDHRYTQAGPHGYRHLSSGVSNSLHACISLIRCSDVGEYLRDEVRVALFVKSLLFC
jgi:hypothetical protein